MVIRLSPLLAHNTLMPTFLIPHENWNCLSGRRSWRNLRKSSSGGPSQRSSSLMLLSQQQTKLECPFTLQEFYIWLGWQFFMACFKGITDHKTWWSGKPILKRRGAPFDSTHVSKNHTSFKSLQWSPTLTRILPICG